MKHIFFVEDDLSLINGLSFALKKQGYEIDIARTSLEADRLWMNGGYDLVILDVSLPDGSGYDLCRKIRQSSKVPIIFLTAADEETDIMPFWTCSCPKMPRSRMCLSSRLWQRGSMASTIGCRRTETRKTPITCSVSLFTDSLW